MNNKFLQEISDLFNEKVKKEGFYYTKNRERCFW